MLIKIEIKCQETLKTLILSGIIYKNSHIELVCKKLIS